MIIDSRYKVIKKLGAGLWATVYKVQDIRTNEIYALKLFQMLDSDSLYEKFSAENMHHITKLQHPNLIHVSNFGNFGKHIYYLSDYFEGKTLGAFKFKKSNIDLLYDIIVQTCYALSALHSQNIIHHDLKPENVVYRIKDNKPILKVMDYGFTKIDVQKNSQKIGRVLPYIAPEVYMGNEAVAQSDYYSLGAILYKITTGILPYSSEQISAIMAGDKHNLFPTFPREINPEIPDGLEKLIMLLLEKDPNDRIKNVESIIAHINSIQPKKYPYSRRWSIVNTIQFSDYIAREDYAHQLMDYLPIMERGNGKIISLTAGKGLGKNNVLTLFRYHLLTDRYYIFDYECSETHKDPFFALIKEFYQSRDTNEKLNEDLQNISHKLKEYLFQSEEEAALRIQDQKELDLDFQSASQFIYHLSDIKPLIFIIRAIEHLPNEVFDFMNFITREVSDRPILIILSTNDPRKLEGLIHSVLIKIEALDEDETRTYVNRLLRVSPPEDFVHKIWVRSNGNPLFIERILIDLTHSHKIWVKNKFQFEFDLDDYVLPDNIKHDIQLRIDHLSKKSFDYFVKLSPISTPLGNDLIKYILGIDDKELFFFLKEGLANELLCKIREFHRITFREAKKQFLSKCSKKEKDEVSRKVLKFFTNINLTIVPIVLGIIEHAKSINDFKAAREYYLRLVQLYSEKGKQKEAFSVMSEVIELDFAGKTEVADVDLRKDLKLLLEKSEWATVNDISDTLQKHIKKMPNIAEKHLIMGVFYQVVEKYNLARKRFEKALEMSVTGIQRISVLLKLAYSYYLQNKIDKMRICIDELEEYELSYELEIEFITYKTLYLGLSGRLDEGIQLAEDYLPQVKADNDANYFIKLGSLHNTLALLYHKKKMLDEADKHFENARMIWERVHYSRKLAIAYNNIGDVALIKGDTNRAFEYFRKAMKICAQVGCKRIKVQGLLNQAQAYLKLGNFNIAEAYLDDALKLTLTLENKPFLNSIINNMAIAKSKINNLNYYLSFVEKNVPDIIDGNIYQITPLTKTYFYYLQEIGDYHTIEKLLNKSEAMFLESREHEFTYQMQGFLALHKNDFALATELIEKAFYYSKKNQSDYALTINYIGLIECSVAMGEYEKAYDICKKVEKLCAKHNFRFWEAKLDISKLKIQLLDEKISIRLILRKLLEVLPYVKDNHLYRLEIEIYEMMVQIYDYLKIRRKAEQSFVKYKELVLEATVGLNAKDKEIYLQNKKHYLKDHTELHSIKIAPRKHLKEERWQDELFDILKLREESRMKFLINRTVNKLLSPDSFAIVLKEDMVSNSTPFLHTNIDTSTLYSKRYLKQIKLCLERSTIIRRSIESKHVIFVPLKIKSTEVGCMILADNGELPLQTEEFNIVKILRLHLTTIMIRIKEFATLNKDMELMEKLVEITRNFFSILSVDKLEQEVIAVALDFTEGSRGFLIKKDKFENYVYKIALDDSKHLLKSYAFISKTILSEVQQLKQPIHIKDVIEDKIFGSYLEYSGDAFSIYCAPILVDGNIHGYLYLDSYNSDAGKMLINREFMKLLLIQISVAFKNAMQYESLMFKNLEISSLDNLKNDFINIASHELNTPLTTLLGYTRKLSRSKLDKADKETVSLMKQSVSRMQRLIKELLDFNKYQMTTKLNLEAVNIKALMKDIAEEAEQISSFRHMQIKLEIEENLNNIHLHPQSFRLIMHHIIINSIRFTKDFGTITLGVRRSTFQQEEIDGKPTLVIYIQDNGIGIPESQLTKVFQKFYELTDIVSHSSGNLEFKSSGLGIGLSIAKKIVELHNGKIWINSKENEGTTVFISLPI
ncbi:MAG: hypothetical protein B1H06_01850 [Candidatus Cloacimonas sp. 4484_143]|nr:MAG: hypothetical protein B1H06_01850 [Candidatus Cloacimonas sp. 4484_143]